MLTPSVEPSGVALATTSVPRLPLAPGLFSTRKVLLGYFLEQSVSDQARNDIGRRSGSKRDDDPHGFRRPVLCQRRQCRQEQEKRECNTFEHESVSAGRLGDIH